MGGSALDGTETAEENRKGEGWKQEKQPENISAQTGLLYGNGSQEKWESLQS